MLNFRGIKQKGYILYVNNILVDPYQEKAILCMNNCLLIAGAGAGKTFTILGKVKYLLEQQIYSESEILLISFTNKSVEDLRKKLPYKLDIFTFHKLAMHILDDYKIYYELSDVNTLALIIDQFFHSLEDIQLQNAILHFFKEYDYNHFLHSPKYTTLAKTISTFIGLYKTCDCSYEDIKNAFCADSFLMKLILIIMKLYENELGSASKYDFDDLIKKATDVLNKPYKYKYIIIDEFQDTSMLRWQLVCKLMHLNQALLFAVGDDFQSIYHFSGCNVNLFLDFDKIVPNASVLKLKYTYRNSQKLIDFAGRFVVKNPVQVKKELQSNKVNKRPIRFITYINACKGLKHLLNKLILIYDDILILQRNNKDIDRFIDHNFTIQDTFLLYKNKKIRFLTVHSSKGLEADVVIIINLIDAMMGFPNKIVNAKVIDAINKLEDNYPYAEERRLFYVALTRTKNEVYLLIPFSKKSVFVKELKKIVH